MNSRFLAFVLAAAAVVGALQSVDMPNWNRTAPIDEVETSGVLTAFGKEVAELVPAEMSRSDRALFGAMLDQFGDAVVRDGSAAYPAILTTANEQLAERLHEALRYRVNAAKDVEAWPTSLDAFRLAVGAELYQRLELQEGQPAKRLTGPESSERRATIQQTLQEAAAALLR